MSLQNILAQEGLVAAVTGNLYVEKRDGRRKIWLRNTTQQKVEQALEIWEEEFSEWEMRGMPRRDPFTRHVMQEGDNVIFVDTEGNEWLFDGNYWSNEGDPEEAG
jgi:hypothetical protein